MKRSIQFQFESGPAPPKIHILGLSFVAIVTGIFALWTGYRAYDLQHHSAQTTGTVIELERSDEKIYPLFEFTDDEGRVHTVRANMSDDRFAVGESVDVVFRPDKPLAARINNWRSLYFFPTLLGILSIAFTIGTALFIRFRGFVENASKARSGELVMTRTRADGTVEQTVRSSVPLLTWIHRLFAAAALLAFAATGWAGWQSLNLAHVGIETSGVITELQRVGAKHRPTFQFTDASGVERVINSGNKTNDYLVGDSVPVIYYADKPEEAKIKKLSLFLSWPAYFGWLGFLFSWIWYATGYQLKAIRADANAT